jgi:hypothetical protein
MAIHHPTECREVERGSFNAAFHDLGLRWQWCNDTYASLATQACERERVLGYLQAEQAHLLRAYDAGFLADAILAAKQRRGDAVGAAPVAAAASRFEWPETCAGQVGF